MAIQAAAALVVSFIMITGTSVPDITIGIMVDTQFELEWLAGVVDKVTKANSLWNSHGGYHLEIKWNILNSTHPTYISRAAYGMINEGIKATVTVLRCTQSRIVSAITETFRIPHLSFDLDLCPPVAREEFTLHQTSEYKTLARALADIAEAADWGKIQLSFHKIVDHITRQLFVVELSLAGIWTILSRPSAENTITDNNIFLVIENGRANTQQNTNVMLKRTKTVFVQDLTSQTIRTLERTFKSNDILVVQVNSLSLCSSCDFSNERGSIHTKLLESGVPCAVFMFHNIFKRLAKTGLSANNCSVCVQNHQFAFTDGSAILKQLKSTCGALKSNICYKLKKPVEYNLHYIAGGSVKGLVHLGQWTESMGLTITRTAPHITNILFPRKITDFGGITLRVVTHGNFYPFSFRVESENTSYIGMMIDIMDDLANKLNFRYLITEAPDGQVGAKNPDGNFTGMVGMVARGEADIGAFTFTVNTERSEVVDFTTGFLQDSLGILTPKVTKSRDLFQVFNPFTLHTWLTILATVLVAVVAFVFICSKTPTKTKDKASQHALLERTSGENIFLLISSYFEQGPTFYPVSVAGRCFLAFWLLFALLTMTMYTAHLAAVLTVSTPLKPIETLQDLADQTHMGVLVQNETSVWTLFKKSQNALYKEIGSRLETPEDFNSRMDMVREGSYCYITDRNILEYIAAGSCAELRVASDRFYSFSLAFIVQKNSPYKPAIDIRLQKMVESGLIETLSRKWKTPKNDCPATDPSEKNRKLGLHTFGGIFIIYIAVIFVSSIVLFIESLQRYFRHSSK